MSRKPHTPLLQIDADIANIRHDRDHSAPRITLEQAGAMLRPEQKLERRIVAGLIEHLASAGFAVHSVHDGEETTRTNAAQAALELIFNLDEVLVRFAKPNKCLHGVLLVIGNGEDILSDWNYTEGDPDGFAAAMNAFDASAFA